MGPDIAPMLKGWDFVPGEVNVRKVMGRDGRAKVQMRLDLGLLQMEAEGRPDGRRFEGCESLLARQTQLRDEYAGRNGTDLGFTVDAAACRELRAESLQYYYRYLALFKLGDWAGVERDTARNLRCLDFLLKYAAGGPDRFSLEQYRPYITMMNARGTARRLQAEGKHEEAAEAVRDGVARIAAFFARYDRPELIDESPEAASLREELAEIESARPKGEADRLRDRLNAALSEERYEDAARLRDEIRAIEPTPPTQIPTGEGGLATGEGRADDAPPTAS
jgi:hypothetical protein